MQHGVWNPNETIVMHRRPGGGFFAGMGGTGGMGEATNVAYQVPSGSVNAFGFAIPVVPILIGLAIGWFLWRR